MEPHGSAHLRFLSETFGTFQESVYLCSMNKKRKEKFGDLLLDIAKYIITAILLATWFRDITTWEWYAYITLLGALIATISVGLSLFKDDDKKKTNKNKKGGK